MELKGSKTEKNLWEAFAGESQARNKYTYFASKAKKEGYEQIASLFTSTADNEKEHAKIWFKLLHDGDIPATSTKWERPVTASMCIGRRALTAIFFEVLQKLCVRFDSEAPKAVTKK